MTLIQALLCYLLVCLLAATILSVPWLRRAIAKNLGALFLVTYMLGFIIYCYGFWFGASKNLLTVALRASISAMEMFALHSDLVEIAENLKEENYFFMVCFSTIHFCAFLFTTIFFIDTFGKRFVSRLESMSYSKSKKKRNRERKLVIIDGTDEKGLSVARSITRDGSTLILFIRGVIDAEVKKFSFADIFMYGMKERSGKSEFEKLGRVIYTNLPLSISLVQGEGWIGTLATKMIHAFKSAEIYFLEWDSENNAQAAYNLSNSLEPGMNVSIHVGVNPFKTHAEKLIGCQYVHPINRSGLIINDLVKGTPILKRGVRGKTLILGFEHTAKACIKTLVENGFTEIDIIDPNVGETLEEFLCFNPWLRGYAGVRYMDFRFESNEFWQYIADNFDSTRNVVIISHDDDQNLSLAAKLHKFARANGKDTGNIEVYVRENASSPEDKVLNLHSFGHLNSIYNHVNFI